MNVLLGKNPLGIERWFPINDDDPEGIPFEVALLNELAQLNLNIEFIGRILSKEDELY